MGAINDLGQVVEHSQVKARKAFVEVEHPIAGTVKTTAPTVRLSKTPGKVVTPAPVLGEHTDAVLRDVLGMSAEEIAALTAGGAFGPAAPQE